MLSYAPKTAKKVVLSSRASMKPSYEEVMDDDLLYMMLEDYHAQERAGTCLDQFTFGG